MLHPIAHVRPPVIDAAHVRPTVIDAARPVRPLNPFAEPHSKNKNNPFEEDSKVSTLAAPAAVRPFQATRQTFDLGSAAVGSAVGSSLDSESQNQPIQNGPGLRLPAFDSAESAMAGTSHTAVRALSGTPHVSARQSFSRATLVAQPCGLSVFMVLQLDTSRGILSNLRTCS